MSAAGTVAPGPAAAGAPALSRDDSKIFISYRRSDSLYAAGRLHEQLCEYFGEARVFMDKSDIGGGADFVAVIDRELSSSGAVVVVIGEQWLEASEGGRRRLDQPGDYVRHEVATGLARGAFVLPVLLDGAKMPGAQELPDDLKPLARRNALTLSDLHWQADVGLLESTLDQELINRGAGIKRAGRRLWRRPLVRAAAGLLALTAAFAAQYRLAYRPSPVDLQGTGLFSPASVASGHHELVIEGPVTGSDEGLLFTHVGRRYEFVDVSSDGARLDEATLAVLRQLDSDPPTAPASLAVLTISQSEPEGEEQGEEQRPAGGEPCRTSVELSTGAAAAMPAAIHVYRLGGNEGERFRSLELKAAGAELLLNTVTAMPAEGAPESLGCRKRLTVGDGFEEVTNGTFAVGAVVAAGGSVRLTFNDARPDARRPFGQGGLFEPFELGGAKLKPGAPAPLRARAVSVAPLEGAAGPGAAPTLFARAAGEDLLSIDSLKVGAEQLQVSVSGHGYVRVNGANFVNLPARIRANPVAVLLFAVADLALLVWFLRQLFASRRRA